MPVMTSSKLNGKYRHSLQKRNSPCLVYIFQRPKCGPVADDVNFGYSVELVLSG
ncbi:hypothetical protein KC19_7G027300 [Ceratodon purpureus]|uniref:Uncharacterized protein n=1 Tax=Ceratodon purpureus TaxID=3225 RepID=A0A8T0H1I2_CERPU|nr:hypothetical protein KC19_7G027300 [Ceratodon purpureus]